MVLALLAVIPLLVLVYLLFYGGFSGPVDWLMRTQRHLRRDRKVVALTFDDGPDPVRTPALLDVLAEANAPATFFLLGDAVEMHPDVVTRMAAEGHELGNHTYCHRYLPLALAERGARAREDRCRDHPGDGTGPDGGAPAVGWPLAVDGPRLCPAREAARAVGRQQL